MMALLNVFYLYRPVLIDEDGEEDNPGRILQGGEWDRERWWHNLKVTVPPGSLPRLYVWHAWQTRWHIPVPFRSLSIMSTNVKTSPRKMNNA